MIRRSTVIGAFACLGLVTACSGTPAEVPSATAFAVPSMIAAASGDASSCAALPSRREQAECLIPIAEDLLAEAYAPVVESRGIEFVRPTIVTDDAGATTECGELRRVAYCPVDYVITLPLTTASALGDRSATEVEWGAETRDYFASALTEDELASGGAYGAIMALSHEYGHHVQSLIGYERINADLMSSNPDQAARYSSEFELMADCFAGWTAAVLDQSEALSVSPLDQWAAITALAEVGDDFIQEDRGRPVAPVEQFNHGAANERANAWVEGAGFGFDGKEPYGQCIALVDGILGNR